MNAEVRAIKTPAEQALVSAYERTRAALPGKRLAGEAALELMDRHLGSREWFAGSAVSLADIMLFPYTHVAQDGGFALAQYPNVRRWLDRVVGLPGFVTME